MSPHLYKIYELIIGLLYHHLKNWYQVDHVFNLMGLTSTPSFLTIEQFP